MKKKSAQSGETRNMDILIDSNVIIDWICRRSEFYVSPADFLSLSA